MAAEHYRLFSWEHSYFSGKARGYLRFKERMGGLSPGFEDILATPDLIQGLLIPKTGSNTVPQLRTPAGDWIQDTSEIIDRVEAAHPAPSVLPEANVAPRQRIAAYLVELLADEWMVVVAFWQRWFHCLPDNDPLHLDYNAQQWGAVLAPDAPSSDQRAAAQAFFDQAFGMQEARTAPRAVYSGIEQLGLTESNRLVWVERFDALLGLFAQHFEAHDFLLGGRPSLGDFGLLGPLYPHLFRDAVPGFLLRTRYPILAEWVERTNGTNALNARTYGQKLYSLDEAGDLVARPALRHGGEWLPGDSIPETLDAILAVFFDEMWPVLAGSVEKLRAFVESPDHTRGEELPGKSFTASPGFETHQTGEGALTQSFELGGVRGRRMVVPYQVWMLHRLSSVLDECTATADNNASVSKWLSRFERGEELLDLSARLEGCEVNKVGGRLYSGT